MSKIINLLNRIKIIIKITKKILRDLDKNINNKYIEKDYNDLFNKNEFYKLTYKHKYEKTDKNNNQTIYGYLCNKYLKQ